MLKSMTYQAIFRDGFAEGMAQGLGIYFAEAFAMTFVVGFAKGRIEEARKLLLLVGRDQFGEPPADVQAALDALVDVDRFEELALRLKLTTSWQELLDLNG